MESILTFRNETSKPIALLGYTLLDLIFDEKEFSYIELDTPVVLKPNEVFQISVNYDVSKYRVKFEYTYNKSVISKFSEKSESLVPIGYIESSFKEKYGTPKQGNIIPTTGKIHLTCFKDSIKDALFGLSDYSHLIVLFVFDKNSNNKLHSMVKPPKLSKSHNNLKKVGVFGCRTPHRPNPIGLTICKIEEINPKMRYIEVSGIDMLDNTPILDIKPYIPTYDSIPDAKVPEWVSNDNKYDVEFNEISSEKLKDNENLKNMIKNLLSYDIRSNGEKFMSNKKDISSEESIFEVNLLNNHIKFKYDNVNSKFIVIDILNVIGPL